MAGVGTLLLGTMAGSVVASPEVGTWLRLAKCVAIGNGVVRSHDALVGDRCSTETGHPGSSTVDRRRRATDGSVVIDECPMSEDCPGYDRDSRVCLLRPDGCEFAPTRGEAVPTVESPEGPTPDASSEAMAR